MSSEKGTVPNDDNLTISTPVTNMKYMWYVRFERK